MTGDETMAELCDKMRSLSGYAALACHQEEIVDTACALMLAVLEEGEFDCCFERREFGKCRCAFSNGAIRRHIKELLS